MFNVITFLCRQFLFWPIFLNLLPATSVRLFVSGKNVQGVFLRYKLQPASHTLTRVCQLWQMSPGLLSLSTNNIFKVQNFYSFRWVLYVIIVNAEFASDFRYAQFYTEDEFCHYNMFNHHCFDGEVRPDTLCLASTDFQFCFVFLTWCVCVCARRPPTQSWNPSSRSTTGRRWFWWPTHRSGGWSGLWPEASLSFRRRGGSCRVLVSLINRRNKCKVLLENRCTSGGTLLNNWCMPHLYPL